MVYHWSLSDSKSPQISWTLLSTLSYHNNAVVSVVSTCPLISESSSLFTNPLGIVPSSPTTIGISVTFMFLRFFNFLTRSWYLSLFLFSFIFTQSTILPVLIFCWLSLGLIVWPRLGDPFVYSISRFYFRFLAVLHRVFTSDLEWKNVMIICILWFYVFYCFFWVIFFRKVHFFGILYKLGLSGILLMCLSISFFIIPRASWW